MAEDTEDTTPETALPDDSKSTKGLGVLGIAALGLVIGIAALVVGSIALSGAKTNKDTLGNLRASGESPPKDDGSAAFQSAKLQAISNRKRLICAIVLSPGFARETDNGDLEGMDIDICRAIAAAALGDPTLVDLKVVTFAERFSVLANDQADVTAISTHTMERDVFQADAMQGFTFTIPYFYEGLGFGGFPAFVDCADATKTSSECQFVKICVQGDGTWIQVLSDLFPENNLVSTETQEEGFTKLEDGTCNVVAGERHDLGLENARANGYTGDYKVGANIFSKEPLAYVTRDDDAGWSDIVNWVIEALLSAEEQGITQATADEIGTVDFLGEDLEDAFIHAVQASGNYGEIYERHLESIVPRGGLNKINLGDSGRLYSHPFGSIDTVGPEPPADGTLHRIIDRGELRCGVSPFALFSRYNLTQWEGFDVDFCRALSAAIFHGDPTRVLFVRIPGSERFKVLADGEVDVLSRFTTHTLGRDMWEPSAETGFTFAMANFYDGLTYGGIEGFVACAETSDVTSDNCSALSICVEGATTFFDIVSEQFSEEFLVSKESTDDVLQGLLDGECNVVAVGMLEIIPIALNESEFVVSDKLFSKDPLALVTRQDDDPHWSDFCYWTVMATVYAEENGITAGNATEMPTTNLFGPLHQDMFKDAIAAVGNYGEIYQRNLEASIARSGLNMLNDAGGPQFYPFPGFF